MKTSRLSAIHQRIYLSYHRHLKRIEAVDKFCQNLDLCLDLKDEVGENPRRVKSKYRHVLTDEDIKQDFDAISVQVYEPRVGDKVQVTILDEDYLGEIIKLDSKEFVLKMKNNEKIKVQLNSIGNRSVKIIKM